MRDLAAAGQDRRPGAGDRARHRPRRSASCLTVRDLPLRPPGPARRDRRPGGRQGDDPGARAGQDHRGPRPGRRHRPAHPERRGLHRREPRPVRRHVQHADSAPTTRGDSRPTRSPGEYFRVTAFAPQGQPTWCPQVEFAWTKGAVKKELDIKVPRGVLIRGKVTEAGTGRPLAGSSIQFIPMRGPVRRRHALGLAGHREPAGTTARSRSPSRPARGTCSSSARPATTSSARSATDELYRGQPGGRRYYAHAIIPYEVKAGDPPREVAAALRPGVTIKGRVEGPDGQTVTDAIILTTLHIEPFNPYWRGDYRRQGPRRPLRAARPRSRGLHADLDPRRRPRVGRDGRGLRQAGRRGPDDPAPALRPGQGAVRRARRQAGRQAPAHASRSSPRPARAS